MQLAFPGLHPVPAGVIRFALIGFIPSTIISATLGVGSLSLAGYADWSDFRSMDDMVDR
jgi:membrane protein DedA with SNARE-associated domain